MPANPRKSTAKSAAAKLAAPAAADPQPETAPDLDAMRAEVAAEQAQAEPKADGLGDEPFPVPLGDTKVMVKPIPDWPASTDELLATGRFTLWAQKILADDQFAEVWVPADPTFRQVDQFILAIQEATGVPFVRPST